VREIFRESIILLHARGETQKLWELRILISFDLDCMMLLSRRVVLLVFKYYLNTISGI